MSMSSRLKHVYKKGLVSTPSWLPDNIHYEVITGSQAYGCAQDDSDEDIYGWCIPPKNVLFPWLDGKIFGFDNYNSFDQYQQHHILDKAALNNKGKEYDFSIYNITRYFYLCANCNPNMIDTLFVPYHCITYCSPIGNMVREKRHLFLCKKAFHTFKGYAYSQISRMRNVQESSQMQKIRHFEEENNLSHDTTYKEVLEEIKKRKIQ